MDNVNEEKAEEMANSEAKASSKASSSSKHSSSKHSSYKLSSKSSVFEAAIFARASAEATNAKASYRKKQLEIKKQQANLELDFKMLEIEKEAAAATARAEVLEAAAAAEQDKEESVKSAVPPQVVRQRTMEYVQHQVQLKSHSSKEEMPLVEPALKTSSFGPKRSGKTPSPPVLEKMYVKEEPFDTPRDYVRLNSHDSHHSYPPMTDFAKFLARRELITTGLFKFDDTPESFRAWQSSFLNATQDIDLTCSQELDLLVKWLGKESSEHVKRIRAVYTTNPKAALQLAWDRLEECYATPEIVENALFKKLDSFPRLTNRDNVKLRELGDLLLELQVAKDETYLPGLAYLDTPRGVKPIAERLPPSLQDKWLQAGSKYKQKYQVTFPPFSYFVKFVQEEAKARNDPSFVTCSNQPFNRGERPPFKQIGYKPPLTVNRTEVNTTALPSTKEDDLTRYCPVHRKSHPLAKCRAFRTKPIQERRNILKEHRRCFRCCSPTHTIKDCDMKVSCEECQSEKHCSAMHPDVVQQPRPESTPEPEPQLQDNTPPEVTSRCTEICGEGCPPRSCSKVCLVRVFPKGQPERSVKMYVILDDQSNCSLARPEFFELFGIKGSHLTYHMRTCAGLTEMCGRKAVGFQIEPVGGGPCLDLPPLIECDEIVFNRNEIPTPEVALAHAHLKHLAPLIPKYDPDAEIAVLLGRDIIQVHKARKQVNGPPSAPFAQCLDLGWVIVGEVCLNAHKPTVNVYKTHILSNGRPSLFTPCPNSISLKEKPCYGGEHKNNFDKHSSTLHAAEEKLGEKVFERTENDNQRALSFEDETFLKIMEKEVHQDESNNWIAPLPFKSPRLPLPNNRDQALSRLNSLRRNLNNKPQMKEQFSEFMDKLFENHHAEIAPPIIDNTECWYLPIFGVYHPQKPGQIRVVFDSSAEQCGVSLNSVLLTGPDLNNTLLGVLIRFRKELIAATADIQQMFYGFLVSPDHRDYLRFLWHKDNDLSKEVQEYRMRVHVFGNSPSPAVAIYCLRRAIQKGETKFGTDTRHFVERHFYVDDGLISLPTESAAIDLLKRTCESLAESNLKLHKIASNSVSVMQAFKSEDLASGIKDLSLGDDPLPDQRSLGMCWDINTDSFTFKVAVNDKPYTRRGVLSVINSIFDPLGLASPVTIKGRLLLRELSNGVENWDAPLPADKMDMWETWKFSLQHLSSLRVPRCYVPASLSKSVYTELCVFCDASSWAIAAVAYLKTVNAKGQCEVGFVLGKAKLSPQPEPTIPRLELCGAVLGVEIAELIQEELDHKPNAVKFYCDSKVVLGYVCNDAKRFYVYVHNRVHRIRQSTSPEQWHYVASEQNPADLATRSIPASQLMDTMWFKGPDFLYKLPEPETHEPFELIKPEVDADIRQVATFTTQVQRNGLTPERFQRFSKWKSLVRAIAYLTHQARSHSLSNASNPLCRGWHECRQPRSPKELNAASNLILQSVQKEAFPDESTSLQANQTVHSSSSIVTLDPYMDEGLIKVGGRLKHASLDAVFKNPIILPSKHHVSKLLVLHYHAMVVHQGRQFTESAVRQAGLWIVGCKRLVSSVIYHCITCRKLRGKLETQKMADLPPERLNTNAPFSYVGLDVFGPWSVVTRRTRGGAAQSKRWAILFTCMTTRGVHIEVIESMDTCSCINAIRRFFAIRGPATQMRSDRGTNFIAASVELGMTQPSTNPPNIVNYLHANGCTWEFNPPHASHMGGVWERMIGVTRKILDSMLLTNKHTRLTHEVLCTLMAEVSSIVNARPLVPITTDPSSPFLLCPAMILTQKQHVLSPPGEFCGKDMLKSQWKQVQALANVFWSRWRNEYLNTLQSRRKWHRSHRDLQPGDIVLLKQNQAHRNEWTMAIITTTFPSSDGKIRKVEVRTSSQGVSKTYLRPISDVVMLLETEVTDEK
ncbi:uncharacterized protein LOC110368714 isoform X1 [Fundulus heteroclitus]|uniref:uncharacterized protein LOC110368714 isoform X1 n=1 Tax=Fundulus heteroclitus TaxID=8078 RepID=UPI00165BEBAD|nr:uncharacterized protein LOC110368714 isoform X1 [Fundulus heteroclitus]XP_035995614.1 uncharacterized protein LOC110368714 isoform X2 [Fundulus heteroclitus]XP_035995615.1 uncharacterized protein LOC110368714 isoform X1 [Fundulus heteroclitus]